MVPTLLTLVIGSALVWKHDSILLEWTPRDWVFLSGFVLLLHLTTFYSLRVRRGALAWAVATLLLATVFVLPLLEMVRLSLLAKGARSPFAGASDGPEVWAPLLYATILACIGMQIAIAAQIRRAVGE